MRRSARHGLALLALVLGGACSRHADIRDDVDSGLMIVNPTDFRDAGLIPIDSGLTADLAAGCAERAYGAACRGANDFPCRYGPWVGEVAAACQERTGCRANGFLAVEMGEDGCVVGLAMSVPDDAFVSCAVEEFSSIRCQCGAQRAEHFLGLGNEGCD